jgi:hypothetical protein
MLEVYRDAPSPTFARWFPQHQFQYYDRLLLKQNSKSLRLEIILCQCKYGLVFRSLGTIMRFSVDSWTIFKQVADPARLSPFGIVEDKSYDEIRNLSWYHRCVYEKLPTAFIYWCEVACEVERLYHGLHWIHYWWVKSFRYPSRLKLMVYARAQLV